MNTIKKWQEVWDLFGADPYSRLFALRIKLNMSQIQFGNVFGVSPRTISRWENNHLIPKRIYRDKINELYKKHIKGGKVYYETKINGKQ